VSRVANLVRLTAAFVFAVVLAACSQYRIPFLTSSSKIEGKVDLIAVMPVDKSAAPSGESDELGTEAERVVTAAVYGALSDSYEWRFVPDLTIADAMRGLSPLDSPEKRAAALAKAVKADAVIFGSVWRYIEREGPADGADRPASVAFTLRLFLASSGEVVWEETYDKTQEALSSNIFDWALFWEEGPHWLSAAELTHIGVDAMIGHLRGTLD
jgi:hypothetical protein